MKHRSPKPQRRWRRRSPQPPAVLYVVVRTAAGRTWPTEPMERDKALREFDIAVGLGCYGPHSGRRVRVMQVGEYARAHTPQALIEAPPAPAAPPPAIEQPYEHGAELAGAIGFRVGSRTGVADGWWSR